ncbi:MAG: alpha/beta hydrolase [Anaerolineae bacterium]|nr:alpha/beta hydrolase [Anaerolineae bacterium]
MTSKTIVFIHGNFVNYQCWDKWVARYEARGYKCIAPPYPRRDKSVSELRKAHPDPKTAEVTTEQVINLYVSTINSLDEKPIIIGHSFGGMLTQLMINRGLGAVGVAIDSVPPQGLLSFKLSFLRSTFPLLNPLTPASKPWLMPFKHYQYAFNNTSPVADQRRNYDATMVPESIPLARGGLGPKAHVDFKKAHVPLLFIGGEKDHIMPASLNRANVQKYKNGSTSITDYKEFAGRDHLTVIAGPGWEEVADYALDWVEKQQPATENGRREAAQAVPVR